MKHFRVLFISVLLLLSIIELRAQSSQPKQLLKTVSDTGGELLVSLKIKIDVYNCGTEKISEKDLGIILQLSGNQIPPKWKQLVGGDFTVIQGEEHSFVVRVPNTELRLKFKPESTSKNDEIKFTYKTVVDVGKDGQVIKFDGERTVKLEDMEVVAGTVFNTSSGKKMDSASSYVLVFSAAIDNILSLYKGKPDQSNSEPVTEPENDEKLTEAEIKYKLELILNHIYQKKFKSAITECEKVLKSDPKNVTALSRLGSAYFSDGEMDKAKEVWLQALKIEPNNQVLQKFVERIEKLKSR